MLARWLFLVPILLVQLLVTCAWDPHPRVPTGDTVVFVPIAVPPASTLRELGPFRLDAIWELRSDHPKFGGYSAIAPLPGGRLIAVGDRGYALRFSPPGNPPSPAVIFPVWNVRTLDAAGTDSESVTRDPATGRIWVGYETKNAIARFDPGTPVPAVANPPSMAKWPDNMGAEGMVRLSDGRFIVTREGFGGLDDKAFFGGNSHETVLFDGDPVEGAKAIRARLIGPEGFFAVDLAQIPGDGRVLVLMRRLVWPIPTRLAVRIAIADPAEIHAGGVWHARLLAKINSLMPMDNFEGMGLVPMRDGRVRVWLISDANSALTQRTLLWKMTLDPKDLTPR